MSYYVGDNDTHPRTLSVLMDWDYTTFYLPIKVDTINEESTGVGVTIEGMLIKDITKIKADAEILYVNTIDDFDAGTLTITPATTISGTLGVTGLITGTTGFSGDITGNVVGDVTGNADTSSSWETTRTIDMSGDVSSDAVNIDGSGNVTITNTVIANDSHTHITANITDLSSATTGITSVGTIGVGVWQGTPVTSTYINSITTSQISDLAIASTGITSIGTIGTGTWQGTAITSTYINSITTSQISDLAIASTGITSIGTIGTGVWNGTTIDKAYLVDVNQSLLTSADVDFNTVTTVGNIVGGGTVYANFIGSGTSWLGNTISNTYLTSINQPLLDTSDVNFNTVTTAIPYEYTYVTKTHSIPATMFVAGEGYTAVYGSYTEAGSVGVSTAGLTNNSGYMIAPLQLPDDCYLDTITVWTADTNPSIKVIRITHSNAGDTSTSATVMKTISTRGTAESIGYQIDNNAEYYVLEYNPSLSYSAGGRMNSVEVKYRVSKADMSYS